MKAWMLALSLVAVLGFNSFATAKEKGEKHDKVHGTIVMVTGKTFTMSVGHAKKGAKAGETVTVDFTNATVTGNLVGGEKVTVEGKKTATGTIDAKTVTVGKAHKKKAV